MGILKDFKEEVRGSSRNYKIRSFFSPPVWLRLHKWRKQRADRGWSGRDTWEAGYYIARVTAEMLQWLNDYSYCDWPEWFKLNVKEEGKGSYKNLQAVINDINAYLDFETTSWADGLTLKHDEIDEVVQEREDGTCEWVGPDYYEGEKKLTEAAITHRVRKWGNEEMRLYKNAQKAMSFFGRHFGGFWD